MQIRHFVFAFATVVASVFNATASGPDIDKVNGSIRLDAGQVGGHLDTVNGSIHLAEHAKAESVETVNGSIDIDSDTEVDSMETVNGAIAIGERARVRSGVEAVNGSITLQRGADVSGKVANVNGRIRTTAARIGGGIETVAGDIDIGADSHIGGGILVDKSTGWWNSRTPKKPRVVIGPNATVDGPLVFKREVELFVSESAKVGTIEGATAQRFSGATPQG